MFSVNKCLIIGFAAALSFHPGFAAAQQDANFFSAIQIVAKGNADIDAGRFGPAVDNCRQVRIFLTSNPASTQINSDLAVAAGDVCLSMALFKTGSTEDGGNSCDYLKSAARLLVPASENESLPQNFKDFVAGLLKAVGEQDRVGGCGIFP